MTYDTWKSTEPQHQENPPEHHYFEIDNRPMPPFYTDDPEEAERWLNRGCTVTERKDTLDGNAFTFGPQSPWESS